MLKSVTLKIEDRKRTRCTFVQAEDGIRDLVRSRGLGDVYKRQSQMHPEIPKATPGDVKGRSCLTER